MEQRTGRIIFGVSGGTAGGAASNYKLSLPSSWVKEMGLTPQAREVVLTFDGSRIMVAPKRSLAEFLSRGREAAHRLCLLSCYAGEQLSARIGVDETERCVCVENLLSDLLLLPFGNNPSPGWKDYQQFLESRCIPDARAGLREYLETIGVAEYSPMEIIRKTQGRMAEDTLWLEVEDIR